MTSDISQLTNAFIKIWWWVL